MFNCLLLSFSGQLSLVKLQDSQSQSNNFSYNMRRWNFETNFTDSIIILQGCLCTIDSPINCSTICTDENLKLTSLLTPLLYYKIVYNREFNNFSYNMRWWKFETSPLSPLLYYKIIYNRQSNNFSYNTRR